MRDTGRYIGSSTACIVPLKKWDIQPSTKPQFLKIKPNSTVKMSFSCLTFLTSAFSEIYGIIVLTP